MTEQALSKSELNKELDRTKSQVFMGSNAAFLGTLMCSIDFIWDETNGTAWTDYATIGWNPDFFTRSNKMTRKATMLHELWHVALLHNLRCGDRDPEIWNSACDYYINNGLDKEGITFTGIDVLVDHQYYGMSEEQIYDILIQNKINPPNPMPNDIRKPPQGATQQAVNNVVQAIHQAKAQGEPGALIGEIEKVINQFLTPVVPWEQKLQRFCTDLAKRGYSWARPNRRYTNMYLPSRFTDKGRLTHLMYFLDVSGSITTKDSIRFNSEVKFVKEFFKPKLLTLVQFDTRISKVTVFEESDPFDSIDVLGGGGTSLVCVRNYILEHRPTAAIIFSDMYVSPMQPLGVDIPIIWVVSGKGGHTPTFGEVIYIN